MISSCRIMILLVVLIVLRVSAADFTSLYAFGDGVCTTTNCPGGAQFYGNRYSNGRVWVEVLADRQGLNYVSNRNWSYFGHDSNALTNSVSLFAAPVDVASALFILWANDADFVFFISQYDASPAQLANWTNGMNRSLTNHFKAIQTLYSKGVRTLVMPNVVDLMQVPMYVQTPTNAKSFIRARIAEFNVGFTAVLNQAQAAFPGLVIHAPNVHALLDDILARPSVYGVTNAQYQGFNIDAQSDPNLTDKSLNGPGRDYIFWDYLDPTARVHAALADVVQNLISAPRVTHVKSMGPNKQLQLDRLPIGLAGFVDGSTNFVSWNVLDSFNCTNASQSMLVPASHSQWFYRLRFPFAWTWP